MRFSIIIPAFNEAENIGTVVRAVLAQSVPRDQFEVIVVDNKSTDDTGSLAREAGADKVVREENPGTNIARARGVAEARGEMLAFADADTEPPPNWLAHIEKDLLRPGVAAVSGPYEYSFRGFAWLLERFANRFFFPYLGKILYFFFRKKSGIILGGNFGAWRWAIEKIGGLPPLKFWGDDVATAMLIARKAGKVVYDPDLRSKSSPRRFKREGFMRLQTRYIRVYLRVYFKNEDEYANLNNESREVLAAKRRA